MFGNAQTLRDPVAASIKVKRFAVRRARHAQGRSRLKSFPAQCMASANYRTRFQASATVSLAPTSHRLFKVQHHSPPVDRDHVLEPPELRLPDHAAWEVRLEAGLGRPGVPAGQVALARSIVVPCKSSRAGYHTKLDSGCESGALVSEPWRLDPDAAGVPRAPDSTSLRFPCSLGASTPLGLVAAPRDGPAVSKSLTLTD